ncbi:class I SAM-dependent methyltransferase [Sphingobacterium psychroaquaticum]|uniref:class I SAM-dependent methyltransferase n=1 Tax=Sphingobacterium psychroaquaticum TaxID=561061 RepID=UPI001F10DCD1|nr:SAM-dependent methyltransferase [Sphingobacterium psychroaquaticum]
MNILVYIALRLQSYYLIYPTETIISLEANTKGRKADLPSPPKTVSLPINFWDMDHFSTFIAQVQQSLQAKTFVKLSLGNYKGSEYELKNIYVKAVLIKRELKLSFTYRYKTRDITKNYSIAEGIAAVESQLDASGFRAATLFTTEENLSAQFSNKGDWFTKREKPTQLKAESHSHDKEKSRKLQATGKTYLQALRLTDAEGNVFKNAQDKWKQINHYIELLSSMLKELPSERPLQVVDMGAGKGYLTFALYDYLRHELNKEASVIGVEYRDDLVTLCNQIAADSSFTKLSFVQGTIEDYQPVGAIDVLIALHACDTATDDAIFKGIQHGAELIVVAPCCHKQIRREMEASKKQNELDFLLQHGIFLERQAEMVTDGLRALILEYHGYQTKVFQFVSDAHTPKNVLVVGVKKTITPERQQEIREKIRTNKSFFGIGYHHLERLTGLEG